MSKQRVSIKNYSHHHHVLLRNRRLMLYKQVLKGENREREVDWFSDNSYILGDNDDISDDNGGNATRFDGPNGVHPRIIAKFLRRRVNIQDVVDVTSRMSQYRALRMLHQWACVRRLYYSHSDAVFSSYSVTALPAHGPLSLSAPGRVKAIANDNIACVKLRHLPRQINNGDLNDPNKLFTPRLTSMASCRERCAALPIPVASYHPNPLFSRKHTLTPQEEEGRLAISPKTTKEGS